METEGGPFLLTPVSRLHAWTGRHGDDDLVIDAADAGHSECYALPGRNVVFLDDEPLRTTIMESRSLVVQWLHSPSEGEPSGATASSPETGRTTMAAKCTGGPEGWQWSRRVGPVSLLAALVLAALTLSGCGRGPDSADAGPGRETRAPQSADPGVRQDRQPVRTHFPELGDFSSVIWKEEILGKDTSRVPGPSDVRVSGVVRLADADVARLKDDYAWRHEPSTPVVLSDIRPHVPAGTHWQTSEDFTAAVTQEHYSGAFHADFEQRIVVFDAINPEPG
ncbi:hypothetical protein WJ438_15570 [Streptomyces sp. GD-15H]|uniref:hypothetical protein n=1 Tax=Streptomyces sp. GD-15H TaxID=3129112 RepID=UPI003243AB4C